MKKDCNNITPLSIKQPEKTKMRPYSDILTVFRSYLKPVIRKKGALNPLQAALGFLSATFYHKQICGFQYVVPNQWHSRILEADSSDGD